MLIDVSSPVCLNKYEVLENVFFEFSNHGKIFKMVSSNINHLLKINPNSLMHQNNELNDIQDDLHFIDINSFYISRNRLCFRNFVLYNIQHSIIKICKRKFLIYCPFTKTKYLIKKMHNSYNYIVINYFKKCFCMH